MNKIMYLFAACFLACLVLAVHADVTATPTAPSGTPAASAAPTEAPTPVPVPTLQPNPGHGLQKTALPLTPEDPAYYSTLFMPIDDDESPNKELQVYLPEQVRVQDRHLYFTAEYSREKYLSGKMESLFSFRYGTIRYRIDTVRGKGLSPAVWLLPASGRQLPEVDIYELVGSAPETFYGVIHYWNDTANDQGRIFFSHDFPNADPPESYELTFTWTPDALEWYLDGQLVHRITEQVPHIPMYLIYNLAVGGNWAGPPDPAVFPAQLHIEMLEFAPEEIYTR